MAVIVDDKLYTVIEHPRRIKESKVREKHRRKLIIIADNLANYLRILLKDDPKKYAEELKKFEK